MADLRKEQSEKIVAEFQRKLDGILNAEQKIAMEQAAAKE